MSSGPPRDSNAAELGRAELERGEAHHVRLAAAQRIAGRGPEHRERVRAADSEAAVDDAEHAVPAARRRPCIRASSRGAAARGAPRGPPRGAPSLVATAANGPITSGLVAMRVVKYSYAASSRSHGSSSQAPRSGSSSSSVRATTTSGRLTARPERRLKPTCTPRVRGSLSVGGISVSFAIVSSTRTGVCATGKDSVRVLPFGDGEVDAAVDLPEVDRLVLGVVVDVADEDAHLGRGGRAVVAQAAERDLERPRLSRLEVGVACTSRGTSCRCRPAGSCRPGATAGRSGRGS